MAVNIRREVVDFKTAYPHKIRFISGKWFDENDDEINNIDKYLFELSSQPEFFKYFLFWKTPTDIHNWEELFVVGYGTNELWPLTKYARLGAKVCTIEKEDLAFPLTYEQALIIGVMLFRPEEECFFICTGVGGSGKSTFGNIVKQLFSNDVANTPIDELAGFKLAEAVKHRLIYSEEISHGELNCSNLKMLASKQEITVEPKYLTPYEVKTQSAMFWNCNRAPKIDIEDSGNMRRLIFYRRDVKIENPDTSLNKKRYSEEELIKFAQYAYRCINECPNWRDVFKKDTFNTIMKDNKIYKFYKEGAKTYEEYKRKCYENDISERFRASDRTWNSVIDYIQENDDEEKLPF